MNNENKAPANDQSNVIQFPGPKAAPAKPATPPPAPKAKAQSTPKPSLKKTTVGTVLAIALMTIAVNKYTFDNTEHAADLSSMTDSATSGRAIASLERASYTRDAAWEKALAERLASPQIREMASLNVGRAATKEEKLRWGILEEKYTINYNAEEHKINSISLQDAMTAPSYILDRPKFLNEYGALFHQGFDSAKLKSVEKSDDKTVEAYTLFDKENNPKGEARFELDRHKRLISLKVEPIQI